MFSLVKAVRSTFTFTCPVCSSSFFFQTADFLPIKSKFQSNPSKQRSITPIISRAVWQWRVKTIGPEGKKEDVITAIESGSFAHSLRVFWVCRERKIVQGYAMEEWSWDGRVVLIYCSRCDRDTGQPDRWVWSCHVLRCIWLLLFFPFFPDHTYY